MHSSRNKGGIGLFCKNVCYFYAQENCMVIYSVVGTFGKHPYNKDFVSSSSKFEIYEFSRHVDRSAAYI
jgi:hypothetical protein